MLGLFAEVLRDDPLKGGPRPHQRFVDRRGLIAVGSGELVQRRAAHADLGLYLLSVPVLCYEFFGFPH